MCLGSNPGSELFSIVDCNSGPWQRIPNLTPAKNSFGFVKAHTRPRPTVPTPDEAKN